MNTTVPSTSLGLELCALTPQGPRVLALPAGGSCIHELLEQLPGGVYSALRTFHHDRFLWLEAHFDRTDRSMSALGWTTKLDRPLLRRALDERVRAYPLADARARFDVLREPFELQGVVADVFLALSPYEAVPDELLERGVRVELARHLQRPTPRIKTTDFVRARKPLPLSLPLNYEGLLVDDQDRILECSSANVAFVRGKRLISAGDGVLEGITALVLRKLAPSLGLEWEQRRLPIAELSSVDEAFLSSSSRGVVPIVQVGETPIGNGRVGAAVRGLLSAYYAFADREARRAVEV